MTVDDADRSDQRIEDVVNDGIERARREMQNNALRPIIQELDGHRYGVCHYCESNIAPGHLYCQIDIVDPENSCSVMAEHDRQRRLASGL